MVTNMLSIDVEDNFTYDELQNKDDWQRYESQVVENTLRILSLLQKHNAIATFFIVGKVAERHPELIKFIIDGKHEVASHSYWHRPLSQMNFDEIEQDISMSSEILSSLTGKKVFGYRAMGYSAPEDEARFFSLLKKYGYIYDSSKKINNQNICRTIQKYEIYQIYPSKISFFFFKKIIFSGGTYFRLLPMFLINSGFSFYRRSNQPVMLYIHPWELNKDQPKRNVSFKQKLLQSPITFTTEKKLTYLLQRYRFISIKDYLDFN